MTDIPATTLVGAADRDPCAALRPFIAAGALAGAVTLVAGREGTLSHGSIGWSDLATKTAMKPDALFWIASMTKPMTGALCAQLIDEGRFSLDDPVEKHLPEFANQKLVLENTPEKLVLGKPQRPITVRDCLCHTSGLPFNVHPEGAFIDRFTMKEACLMYGLTPLNAQPGAVYAYSNAGINVAARVAEVTTGCRYDDLMHDRLLDPLGMRDTVMVPDSAQVARLAKTYRGDASGGLQEIPVPQLTHPLNLRSRQASPAGGYVSGADDCARFGRMLLGGGVFHGRRVMSAAAVREMTRKQTGALEASYGLGIGINPDGFHHGGAISTNLHIDTKLGIIHVYLVQQAGYAGPDGAKVFPAFHAAANALAP